MLGGLLRASAGGPLDLQTCAAQSVCHPVLFSKTFPEPPGRIGVPFRGAVFFDRCRVQRLTHRFSFVHKTSGPSRPGRASSQSNCSMFSIGNRRGGQLSRLAVGRSSCGACKPLTRLPPVQSTGRGAAWPSGLKSPTAAPPLWLRYFAIFFNDGATVGRMPHSEPKLVPQTGFFL